MAAAIAAGLLSPTLRAKLEAAEVEHTRLVSDQSASNTPMVADFLPRLADIYSALVESLESVPPRYVDRARTTLKGLIGDVQLHPRGTVPDGWIRVGPRGVLPKPDGATLRLPR